MPVLTRALGAGIVGISVWCAAGSLTVATPDSAAARLASPASPLWAVVGFAVALAVPGWRRPIQAAPALFATLPWWPVPVPTAFMVFTGPLAWWPIGLAVACAWVFPRERRAQASPRATRSPGRSAFVAGIVTLAAATATAVSVAPLLPGGDEPHYLIIADSLIRDGDLRIENNHENGDYRTYVGVTIAPDFIKRGVDGEIYSIHAPGVPVLVLPAFAAAGYRGAQATMLACAAVAGGLVWLIAWRVTGRTDAAWFAWAAVTFTPPTLLHAGMVFPDGPGALAAGAGIWLAVRLQDSTRPTRPAVLVGAGALLALLPWFHTRFSVLAGGLGSLIVWRILRGGPVGVPRLSRLAAFGALPAMAAAAWFAYFWIIYGTVDPSAPYGDSAGPRLAYVPGGGAALLFDQQFGLLAYSPVLAAAVLGLRGAGPAAHVATARAALLIGLAYAVAVTTYWMWWAGLPASPARFLTAALPLAAVPLARGWAAATPAVRGVLLWLLVVSAAIAAVTVGIGRGALAWNTRDGLAAWLEWLGPVVDLPRAWPSFFWWLDPSDLLTEWPFVRHALVASGLVVGGLVAAAWKAGPRSSQAFVSCSLSMPVVLMVAAMAGWTLNGVNGLEPARSQVAAAATEATGRALVGIGPWGIRSESMARGVLRIRPDAPGRSDAPPSWAVFEGLPSATYELDVTIDDPPPVRIDLRIGRSAMPLRTVVVEQSGAFTVPFRLPAGAGALVIESSEMRVDRPGQVTLRLGRLLDPGPLALQSARYGDVDVHFVDRNVFVEADGFWIRGSTSAGVVLVRDTGPGLVTLRLQNGGAANRIGFSLAGRTEEWDVQASDFRHVDVPVGPDGIRLTLGSAGGFRPSDAGASTDSRWLGVRVELVTR